MQVDERVAVKTVKLNNKSKEKEKLMEYSFKTA